MNLRIAAFSLVLLSLAACGQSGKLVLPEKNVETPKAAETKPTVVAPVTDAAPTTPAQDAPDAQKKVQP
jgi:predicted small lipoprotein YifL